ncbi:MAG: hypothetical protein AMJ84_12545 [Acidithiobacillales bacterium SM23_46]|nr:MAG: hypothetical protein AMJ84_12545 [Acidithiobacillales bacterium SM23_46]
MSYELPQKLFYRIQEVSRITGVKPSVLRYWESEFPLLNPEKSPSDQRRYRPGDIDLVRRIKELLYEEKFTIAGARRQLEAEGNGRAARRTAPVRSRRTRQTRAIERADLERIARQLGCVRRELEDLQAFLAG